MAAVVEPEQKVFDDNISDDAVLEQLGYKQGKLWLLPQLI